MNFEDFFKNAHYGIVVSRRQKAKHGIRLFPYCEVYGKVKTLQRLKMQLLNLSVSCTVKNNFLRIQGIRNCSLITQYVPSEQKWFQGAVQMFEQGRHLEPEGIIQLIKIRNERQSARPMEGKVTVKEAVKTVLEH